MVMEFLERAFDAGFRRLGGAGAVIPAFPVSLPPDHLLPARPQPALERQPARRALAGHRPPGLFKCAGKLLQENCCKRDCRHRGQGAEGDAVEESAAFKFRVGGVAHSAQGAR